MKSKKYFCTLALFFLATSAAAMDFDFENNHPMELDLSLLSKKPEFCNLPMPADFPMPSHPHIETIKQPWMEQEKPIVVSKESEDFDIQNTVKMLANMKKNSQTPEHGPGEKQITGKKRKRTGPSKREKKRQKRIKKLIGYSKAIDSINKDRKEMSAMSGQSYQLMNKTFLLDMANNDFKSLSNKELKATIEACKKNHGKLKSVKSLATTYANYLPVFEKCLEGIN